MLEGSRGFVISPVSRHFHRAAGARRGVCNCIQTTILLGPPAEGRPGPSDDNDDDSNNDYDGNDDDDDDGDSNDDDVPRKIATGENILKIRDVSPKFGFVSHIRQMSRRR